jgi:hypothetical protein
MTETYSRFGGLWIDRRDSADILAMKLNLGVMSPELGKLISDFMRDGFVILPGAVDRKLTTRLREELDEFWVSPPDGALVENLDA